MTNMTNAPTCRSCSRPADQVPELVRLAAQRFTAPADVVHAFAHRWNYLQSSNTFVCQDCAHKSVTL